MKSICKNRKAYFEYEILEKHICGLVLGGSEVKSIKKGTVSIAEAYCYISNNEIFIKGMHVSEFKEGGKHNNHDVSRDRKLLMKKKEIIKLADSVGKKGLTIVPIEIKVIENGLIKIEIGLGRGKNLYDKKVSIKLKDLDRDLKRN